MKIKKSFFIILILIPILSFSQSLEYKLDKPNNLFIGTPFHILVEIASNPEDSLFTPEIDTLDVFILKNVVSGSAEMVGMIVKIIPILDLLKNSSS